MKRLFLIPALLLSALLFALPTPASAKDVTLGVAWAGKSGMANRILKGLQTGLAEVAPSIKVEVVKNLPNIEELAKVAKRFEKEKSGMVILRSNGAKWLAKNPPSIPTFIGGCNNPTQLGVVKNMEAPEGKVTGVTYFLPVKSQFQVFKALLPNMKSVLLLLEKGHPGSPIDQHSTKVACKQFGVAYAEKFVSTKDEALAAAKSAQGKYSAIIIGNQALLLDLAKSIVAAAGNTPVLAYSNKPVKDGALGGFVADDGKLGYMLAKSVAAVLLKGKAIKDVPVKVDPDPKFSINVTTAEKLKISVPYEILESANRIK